MATTSNTFTGNGSTKTYSFTFPYLATTDIKIQLTTAAGVDKDITAYTLPSATSITFTALGGSATDWQETTGAPKSGVTILIYRDTDSSSLSSTFYPGSAIRSSDLNDNFTQNLYVTQEAEVDVAEAQTDAAAAVTTANTANTTANTANTTANTASTNATNAVNTANTASTNATNAVSTANTASTNATAALNNSRESDGSGGYNSAISIANTASTNATNAVNTANTASTNASNAVSTANAADTIADNAKLATDRLVATTSNGGATWTLTGNNTNASTDPKGVGYAVTQAEAAVTTANAAAADVAAAVLYTSVANKTALEALTPSEDGYYEVKDSTGLANATWGTPTYTLSGIPGTYPSSALDGITTRLSFTLSSKTFAYSAYTVNDADNRYLAPGDLLDEDDMATNSATKVASQQSVKAYADLKAPIASPTFTGTVAIPNISNLETAVAANTAKATNVTTNLSVTANGTSLTVASSDGTDASIPAVTTSAWGAMTDEDKTKLDGIATGATANVGDAVLANDQNWTGAQRGNVTALSSSSNSTAVDFNSGNNFSLTLGENSTIAQPSNQVAGQSGSIFVTQDGTGSRTLAYHADWKWVGGTAPTLTTTAAAVDRIDYVVAAANKIHAVASLDVK